MFFKVITCYYHDPKVFSKVVTCSYRDPKPLGVLQVIPCFYHSSKPLVFSKVILCSYRDPKPLGVLQNPYGFLPRSQNSWCFPRSSRASTMIPNPLVFSKVIPCFYHNPKSLGVLQGRHVFLSQPQTLGVPQGHPVSCRELSSFQTPHPASPIPKESARSASSSRDSRHNHHKNNGGIPSPRVRREGQSRNSASSGSWFCSSQALGATKAAFPQGFSSLQHKHNRTQRSQREALTIPPTSPLPPFNFNFFSFFNWMQNEAK